MPGQRGSGLWANPWQGRSKLRRLIGGFFQSDNKRCVATTPSILKEDFLVIFFPRRGRADPGGTAIPGQPVAGEKQASTPHRRSKNQIISLCSIEHVSEIKLIRTDTTLKQKKHRLASFHRKYYKVEKTSMTPVSPLAPCRPAHL